jgi:hypothetical protein
MQNHGVRQNRVHGGFNGSTRVNLSRINLPTHVSLHLAQIQWNEDVFVFGIRQPSARSFDPKNIVELDRRVACARLRQQRIAPNSCRELPQLRQFSFVPVY